MRNPFQRAMISSLAWLMVGSALAQDGSINSSVTDIEAAATDIEATDLEAAYSDTQLLTELAAYEDRPEYPDEIAEHLANDEETFYEYESACDSCGSGKCTSQTFGGRLRWAISEALCACDECYKPEWHLIESASFWVDSARTQNRMRVRWDHGIGMILPDRAEYFWARVGSRGPDAQAGSRTVNSLDYHELSVYAETAHGNFSAFTVTPYRSLYMNEAGHSAGFGDIQIGTKSMLHDTPLLQVTLQMTTTIPSANPKKGLGTGHVSLEPSLLFGLSLTSKDFLQAQVAEWIPLGGDVDYSGALLRWGVSWNRILWSHDHDNVMTANLDFVGWSFQHGSFTDPLTGQQSANDESYLYVGPGSRFLLCGKYEFGFGGLFALSDRHFAEHVVRTDFTMRY